MTTSLYRPILKTAFRIALHERRLWWHALFGGLVIGTGFGSAIVQMFGADPVQNALYALVRRNGGALEAIGALFAQARVTGTGASVALFVYFLFVAAIIVLMVWLAVIGTNVLFLRAQQPSANLAELRRRAAKHFWPALRASIILRLAALFVIVMWGGALFRALTDASTFATTRGVATFVLTAILLVVLHVLAVFTVAGIVIDRRAVLPALREAAALVRTQWLIAIEASALFSLANTLAVACWIVGSFFLALPFLFLAGIAIASGHAALLTVAMALGLVVLAVFLVLIVMVFTTFLITGWGMLYLALTAQAREPHIPWIVRTFRRHPSV